MFADLPELALAVRQPWAWAILNGKDIENRHWRAAYRGPIALHASQNMTLAEYREAEAFIRIAAPDLSLPDPRDLRRGGIIGVADIVDCVVHSSSPWFTGPYGLVLHNARPVPFIPVKGLQSFFKWKALAL